MAASLPFLAFEGATKKNKPQLKVVCYYVETSIFIRKEKRRKNEENKF
jgi:hypothetical protein